MVAMSASTPLMKQYWAIKNQHKDQILFFRMGDFYELFYDDAKIASKVLGLTLTSRGHGTSGDVPLAGFPYHALDSYLYKMIKAGYKVAICEQVEDPKTAKTIVKREVIDIVTPGTVLSDQILEGERNNYLAAVYFEGETAGLAKADFSTGEFSVIEFSIQDVYDYLSNIQPSEVLVSTEQAGYLSRNIRNEEQFSITKREEWLFARTFAYETLTNHFKTATLKGFGCEDLTAGLGAAGVILHYLQETKKSEIAHFQRLRREFPQHHMILDQATLRNLEILNPISREQKEGSLISVMDQTLTPMGGRLIRQQIRYPLRDIHEIRNRLDSVEDFLTASDTRARNRKILKSIGDLERIISKICARRCNARDFVALKDSIKKVSELIDTLQELEGTHVKRLRNGLDPAGDLVDLIEEAIEDEPPISISDGGFIRKGFHEELDEYREMAFSGKSWIANHQSLEREKMGISSLKVGYNKIFGYYIEITKPHLDKVPETYIRKQTLVNAERFITPELKEYEEKILTAEEKMAALEYELFEDLRKRITAESGRILATAHVVAQLDVLISLAELAESAGYVKPIVDDQDRIEIREGRHPVVEGLLPIGEDFIPNDTIIDNENEQVLVITGPNMAGKSTYIRQVGLIALMAQMGSFVPARSARIGVVDRIFTRVGASDNLAGGESTFMVEMTEMANILNNATRSSLLLLDEIGRGTSTFDGLSIAWAVAEYLHNAPAVAARTLFATHYHELTELELILPRVKNYNIAIKEWGDKIIFLRKIEPGGCDNSYGIQVARLAGLPSAVIQRAREVLANLEADELTPGRRPRLARSGKSTIEEAHSQLDLFKRKNPDLYNKLQSLKIEELTPLEALNKLQELKEMLNNTEK